MVKVVTRSCWCPNILSRTHARVITSFAGWFISLLHPNTKKCVLVFLKVHSGIDAIYRREGSGRSIQKQGHQQTYYGHPLGHCSSICRKGEKKVNNLFEIGPLFCCGKSFFGARKEGTQQGPNKREQKRHSKKRRRRYNRFALPSFTGTSRLGTLPVGLSRLRKISATDGTLLCRGVAKLGYVPWFSIHATCLILCCRNSSMVWTIHKLTPTLISRIMA